MAKFTSQPLILAAAVISCAFSVPAEALPYLWEPVNQCEILFQTQTGDAFAEGLRQDIDREVAKLPSWQRDLDYRVGKAVLSGWAKRLSEMSPEDFTKSAISLTKSQATGRFIDRTNPYSMHLLIDFFEQIRQASLLVDLSADQSMAISTAMSNQQKGGLLNRYPLREYVVELEQVLSLPFGRSGIVLVQPIDPTLAGYNREFNRVKKHTDFLSDTKILQLHKFLLERFLPIAPAHEIAVVVANIIGTTETYNSRYGFRTPYDEVDIFEGVRATVATVAFSKEDKVRIQSALSIWAERLPKEDDGTKRLPRGGQELANAKSGL